MICTSTVETELFYVQQPPSYLDRGDRITVDGLVRWFIAVNARFSVAILSIGLVRP